MFSVWKVSLTIEFFDCVQSLGWICPEYRGILPLIHLPFDLFGKAFMFSRIL